MKMSIQNRILVTSLPLAFAISTAGAAIIIDPTLTTGTNSIDPTGGTYNATGLVAGAATKSALEATTGFAVIQSFTGASGASGSSNFSGAIQSAVNYFRFTTPGRPDIRITTISGNNSGGGSTSGGTTSGASAQYLGGGTSSGGVQTQMIEFGTYDTMNSTFAADKAVNALGFMLAQDQVGTRTWTVNYFDASGSQIGATQSSGAAQGTALLFGTIQSSNNIRRVEIGFTGTNFVNTFMDDLGFAVVPEPSVALLSIASLGLLLRRRR